MKKVIITGLFVSTIYSCATDNDSDQSIKRTINQPILNNAPIAPQPEQKPTEEEAKKVNEAIDNCLKLTIPASQGDGTRQNAGVQSLHDLQNFLSKNRDGIKEKINELNNHNKKLLVVKLMHKITTSVCNKCNPGMHSYTFDELKDIFTYNFDTFRTINEEQLEALDTISENIFDNSYAATIHHDTSFDEPRIVTLLKCKNMDVLKKLCADPRIADSKFNTKALNDLVSITDSTQLETKIQAIMNS